ncbi:MAG: PhzF family phenazine biosynthesis protein [Actinobacteria bacterium]|nr:PhzF family phenazine biosynthesis protein [Actinomycetota bacterium]
MSTEQLQAIAQEFALSETAFPMAAEDTADYRLRIFTPATELPFAGHPSVGAADVLRRLGRIGTGRVVQSCGAGLLPLEVTGTGVTVTGGPATWSDPLDPAAALAAVGLSEALGEVRTAGCGIEFTYLQVGPEDLARVRADLPAVEALGGTGLCVFAWDGVAARSRVFAAGAGVGEDPATGSAAVGLGVHLVVSGLLPTGETSYDVTQGVEMGRPSLLHCTVQAQDGRPVRATVGGSVVPVARGEVRVP